MKDATGKDPGVALLWAWLVPGAGHWYGGRRGRAGLYGASVVALFVAGLWTGGISCVSVYGHKWAFLLQIFDGPMTIATALASHVQPGKLKHLVREADPLFAHGELGRATEVYREAASSDPQSARAALGLGHALLATGAYAEAAAELRRGIALRPSVAGSGTDLRDIYGSSVSPGDAFEKLTRHVAAAPGDTDARFLLAYLYCFAKLDPLRAENELSAIADRDSVAGLFLQRLRDSLISRWTDLALTLTLVSAALNVLVMADAYYLADRSDEEGSEKAEEKAP